MNWWETLVQKYHGRQFDRFVQVVAVLMAVKILLTRYLILGHAFGLGGVADVTFVFAVTALVSLLNGRRAKLAIAVTDLVFSIMCVGSVIYASYFDQLPGIRMLSFVGQTSQLLDDIVSLLAIWHLLLVVDLPFVFYFGYRHQGRQSGSRSARVVFGATALTVLALFAVLAGLSPVERGNFAGSYWYGLVPYEIAMAARGTIEPKPELPNTPLTLQQRIDKLTGRVWGARKPDSPKYGEFKGYSVVVVQVEALQAALVGARIEGKPVVPNLEQLISRSYYYPNMYSQIGRGNTSDAEFLMNTSLYPSREQASCLQYAKKELPSLPNMLNDEGYSTLTFHANYSSFWNRFQLYPALGFSHYCDRTFFGDEDIIGMGPSDEVLYRKTLPVILAEVSEGRPIYAQLITLSSHYPYSGMSSRGPLNLSSEISHTMTGKYLAAEAYADQQLGEFIYQLEASGAMDRTILVVYGDHFGMRFSGITEQDRAIRKKMFGRLYNRADFYNVPLIVHVPGQTEEVLDKDVMGEIDIMPTIADLLGLDLTATPHFGRSAFVRTPTLLTRPSSIPTYIDDSEVYLGGITDGEDRWYSSTAQTRQAPGVVPERLGATLQLLDMCDQYVEGLPDRPSATDAEGYVPNKGADIMDTPWK